MKVLIATSSRQLSEALCRLVSMQGYDVVAAYDGVQAVGVLQQGGVDVLVAECWLPRLSPAAVLTKQPVAGSIGILSFARPSVRQIAVDMGFDILLPKPFGAMMLLNAIQRLSELKPSVVYDDVTLNYGARALYVGGKSMHCTLDELDMLQLIFEGKSDAIQLGQTIGYTPLGVFRAVRALDAKLRGADMGLVVRPVAEGYKVGRV